VTGAALSSHTFGELESTCPDVSWAGEVLYVEEGVCVGSGAVGAFFDAVTGTKLGLLGGTAESASAYGVTPIVLASGLVAFRQQRQGHLLPRRQDGSYRQAHEPLVGTREERIRRSLELAHRGWMHSVTTADGKTELVIVNGAASRKRVLAIDPDALTITRMFELAGCP